MSMDSGGSSESTTQTSSTDNRMVLDGGSIGVTSASENTINVLDGGAVKGALDLAALVVAGSGAVVERGVQVQEQQAAYLSQAYTDAKGSKDVLVVGGLLVGAVAIAFILKR
jgi:hypothetical protein